MAEFALRGQAEVPVVPGARTSLLLRVVQETVPGPVAPRAKEALLGRVLDASQGFSAGLDFRDLLKVYPAFLEIQQVYRASDRF